MCGSSSWQQLRRKLFEVFDAVRRTGQSDLVGHNDHSGFFQVSLSVASLPFHSWKIQGLVREGYLNRSREAPQQQQRLRLLFRSPSLSLLLSLRQAPSKRKTTATTRERGR
mmetsp:Transcript_2017/g.5600  ORF Transcript_2017/g.5600 Transcript_2017/m.5600 type:complete len:111 (-) Transcript_2017:395-727(-)